MTEAKEKSLAEMMHEYITAYLELEQLKARVRERERMLKWRGDSIVEKHCGELDWVNVFDYQGNTYLIKADLEFASDVRIEVEQVTRISYPEKEQQPDWMNDAIIAAEDALDEKATQEAALDRGGWA